jgi:hypothetical protein
VLSAKAETGVSIRLCESAIAKAMAKERKGGLRGGKKIPPLQDKSVDLFIC